MGVSKKGQVTIFIIIGVLIAVGVLAVFLFKSHRSDVTSKELKKGEEYYLSCLSDRAKLGISLLGQQGGYIYTENIKFHPGSTYMPSSSQLDFYGNPIPYWLFVSGNNILVEQKPSIDQMERELSRFIYEGLGSCNFKDLNNAGIFVDVFDGKVSAKINPNTVEILSTNSIFINFENQSASVNNHKISIRTKLGDFYSLASKLYDKEKEEAFLEEYGLDVLYGYAPVTGVDMGCSPKIFVEENVKQDIFVGLEENIPFLKLKGDYYTISKKENSYFVIDLGEKVSSNVNFLYSKSWPTGISMYGDKIVQPVGMQEGLSMLGLCYTPYHFVYDLSFPVVVQFFDESDIFQFGMVAIIQNNQARNAVLLGEEVISENRICANADKDIEVRTYDLERNPIGARISFSCLGETCDVGATKGNALGGAYLKAKVPACVNGVLTAYSENYTSSSYTISTNKEFDADIFLKKIHEVNVSVTGAKDAVIIFSSEDYTSVLNYPGDRSVKLAEGAYNITAYSYAKSSISFSGTKQKKCLDVPSSSIGGIFGATESKCFDLEIPAQTIDSVLVGGGMAGDYFADRMLSESEELSIYVPTFKAPTKVEDISSNYAQWEVSRVDLNFK